MSATCAAQSFAEPSFGARALTELRISAGSRPISAHRSRSTSWCPCQSAGDLVMAFHACACRATARRVRVGPLPPIVIGGIGRCTGFGSQRASVSCTY